MSYTYLALYGNGVPAASFHQKHELRRWLRRGGSFRNECLRLFRIRSEAWNEDSIVVELELHDGELIAKAA